GGSVYGRNRSVHRCHSARGGRGCRDADRLLRLPHQSGRPRSTTCCTTPWSTRPRSQPSPHSTNRQNPPAIQAGDVDRGYPPRPAKNEERNFPPPRGAPLATPPPPARGRRGRPPPGPPPSVVPPPPQGHPREARAGNPPADSRDGRRCTRHQADGRHSEKSGE